MAIQTGPVQTPEVEATLGEVRELIRTIRPSPDLVVLPELFALPFWCLGFNEPEHFSWAEGIDGPTLSAARKLARHLDAVVVAPFFERGAVAGEFYNSVGVIESNGELVEGTLPSGRSVATYRKNAISAYRWDDQVNDEKFYFREGPGYPVFRTSAGVLGILVCYDRWFPEAWRVLALQGAEVICVPNASQGDVGELFVPSMRTCAAQHLLYVVAANRAGTEEVGGRQTHYYGLSCLVDPRGTVLAQAGAAGPEVICADIDLAYVAAVRLRQTMYRDRRPVLYGLLAEETCP